MVQLTTLAAATAAGFFVLGRHELLGVARAVGYISGKSVTLLRRTRDVVTGVGGQSEYAELQRELQEGVREIRQIRNELTGVTAYEPPIRPSHVPTQPAPQPVQQSATTRVSPMETADSEPSRLASNSTNSNTSESLPGVSAAKDGISLELPPMDARELFPKSQSFKMDHRTGSADLVQDAILESYTPRVQVSSADLERIRAQGTGGS